MSCQYNIAMEQDTGKYTRSPLHATIPCEKGQWINPYQNYPAGSKWKGFQCPTDGIVALPTGISAQVSCILLDETKKLKDGEKILIGVGILLFISVMIYIFR